MTVSDMQHQPEKYAYPKYAASLVESMGPEFRGIATSFDSRHTLVDNGRIFYVILDVPERIYDDGGKWARLRESANNVINECRRNARLSDENIGVRFERVNPESDRVIMLLEGGKMYGCLLYTSPSPRDS